MHYPAAIGVLRMSSKADNKKEPSKCGQTTNPNEVKRVAAGLSTSPSTTVRGQPMPSRKLNEFLNVHVPRKGYLAINDEIELYTKKNLSFECACSETHPVTTSLAVIDFPLENKGLYLCPNNESIFVLVKATGTFRVKGLKTIASYEAENASEQQQIMSILESRKKRG